MAEWRLLHSEAVGGELLGELPFISVDASESLNGSGSWSASLPLDDIENVTAGSTVVYLDRDGVILFAGMVWTADSDYGAGTMSIGGAGLGSYYAKRICDITFNYTGIEQTSLAALTITAAEAVGTGIGVVPVTKATGVFRDRVFSFLEAKPVLEIIEQLGAVENGFDIRWRARWSGGVPIRELLFDYPNTGRLLEIVFEVGVNCAVLGYSEDAGSMANYVLGLGAGEGEDKLRRSATYNVEGSSVPRLDATISHLDVSLAATLDGHVERRLTRGLYPIRRVNLLLVPGTDPPLGSFDVGDRVYVRASRGWMNVADFFRIVDISYKVDDSGEQVSLTLAGFESFE